MKGWRVKLSAKRSVIVSLVMRGAFRTLCRAKLREGLLCGFWMSYFAQGVSQRLKMMAMISIEFGPGKGKATILSLK